MAKQRMMIVRDQNGLFKAWLEGLEKTVGTGATSDEAKEDLLREMNNHRQRYERAYIKLTRGTFEVEMM